MTPKQKIKHAILLLAENPPSNITEDNIDDLYDLYSIDDIVQQIREGEIETDIPETQYSRHYAARSVASIMPDGSWVGWTYWYGGGKHGEPQSMDWMSDAYNLDVVEEEKMVVVRTFTKKD